MEAKQPDEDMRQKQADGFTTRVALIGFFGGLFWGIFGFLAYYLNLSKVGPALVLNPWALGDWKTKAMGQLIGIVVLAVLSIGIAFVYRGLFIKFKSVVAGMFFGAVLWALVFYMLQPIFPDLKPLTEIGWHTITTTFCLFAMYGLFVGYSISYDYYENRPEESYSKN